MNKDLDILSSLLFLLSRGHERDFARLSNTTWLPIELRECLSACVHARRSLCGDSPKARGSRRPRLGESTALLQRLNQLVLDKQVFESNEALAHALNALELDIAFDKRDGRPRMRDKLSRAIESLPELERERVAKRLSKYMTKSETAEWFDAIRRGD